MNTGLASRIDYEPQILTPRFIALPSDGQTACVDKVLYLRQQYCDKPYSTGRTNISIFEYAGFFGKLIDFCISFDLLD